MAYALDFGLTSNGYVSVDCSTSDGSPNWEIEFKFKPVASPVSSFYRIAGEASPAGAQNRIIISTSGNDFRYYRNGLNYRINTSVDLSAEPVIMFKSNGNGVDLYIDDNFKGKSGSGVVGVGLGNLGANFNTYFDGQLYYFKFTDFNTPSNSREFKKEVLSGDNDTVYNDLTNGQDGTQSGTWPSNNSEWVFYNDGGAVDVTITLESGAYSLSGTDANILKDSFLTTEFGSYLKEGKSVGLLSQRNISTELGNYSYSGNDVEVFCNRSLPFDTGAYTKEGSNVSLIIDRFLSAQAGNYTYIGQDVGLSYSQSLTLTLGTGTYAYQGSDQGILKDFLLPVESGNYTYETSNVSLLADRRLLTQSGDYTKTGTSINFVYEANGITYTLSFEEGSYLKQGTPLRMLADRLLPVDTGEYLYEGVNSGLLYNRVVALDSGMYSSAGTDLGKKVNRRLQFNQGNYSLVGTPITLSYTGEVLAILEGYSINYKQDAVNDCLYKQDILSIRYK